MKDKRYVVTFEAYVYAPNDYMARKRAHEVVNNGKFGKHAYNVALTAIDEQPFASLNSRKLEDISNPLNKVDDELPF